MFGQNKSKRYDIPQDIMDTYNYAKIKTSKGDIIVKLYKDDAPNTVANFAHLANTGFYNNLNFHRVIPGFMAQGGCPTGTGTGGPDWAIECETASNTSLHRRGTLSMAHAGPNTGGSQFFICFVDCPHLDGVHTTFGAIEENDQESFKVLDLIEQFDIIEKIEIFENKE